MSMRLQELHPSLVHFPIALLPTSLAADALGRLTDNEELLAVGRLGIAAAAGGAALAGVAGLLAQEASRFDDESHDILVTHRNLNLGLLGLVTGMAISRSRQRRPGLGYLALGAVGLLTMSYSAYLGGHMVYEHGVGVSDADGLREEEAPELRPANAGVAARTSARHLRDGLVATASALRDGELVPWITREHTNGARRGQAAPRSAAVSDHTGSAG